MKFPLRPITFAMLLLLFATPALAETRYVSDQLIVTVRSGKGNDFKILETVPTATPVKIVEEGKHYVKVITPKGTEGYISRRYISKQLPKKTQIKQLNQELTRLQQQLTTQQQNINGSKNEVGAHKTQIKELTAQLSKTRQEFKNVSADYKALLNTSENVLNISAENKQLIEETNLINSELLVLREENKNFHRSNMIQWFLAGGSVFFGGWLIGKISRKKQRRF